MSGQSLRSNRDSILRKVELTDKEREYHYNLIKGRIAETLIEELFLSMNYHVYRFGMENTIPGIMELLKGNKSEVAQEIRRMPDFVVQHKNSREVQFIEVKFRANGLFDFNGLKENYPYSNAYVILVSRKHIKCLSVKELSEGKCFTPDCANFLGSRREFELNNDVIREYCQFAVQFFQHA